MVTVVEGGVWGGMARLMGGGGGGWWWEMGGAPIPPATVTVCGIAPDDMVVPATKEKLV